MPRNSCLQVKQKSVVAEMPLKKRRHRVSFSCGGHEQIEAPLPETLRPKEGRFTFEDHLEHMKPRGRTVARRDEDRARANLNRLTVNHRRVARRCSCGDDWCSCDCRCALNFAASCLFENPMRHAAIDGDIMLLGHQPGVPETVILLAGANVSVDGASVSISNEDIPTIVQTLDTRDKAQQWASKVKLAADLWEDCQTLAEAALKQKSFHRSGGGTGGNCNDIQDNVIQEASGNNNDFPDNDFLVAQLENSRLKEQIEALLARVAVATVRAEEANQIQMLKVVEARSADILWIQAISSIASSPPEKTLRPSKNGGDAEGSLWRSVMRWMPGLPVLLS